MSSIFDGTVIGNTYTFILVRGAERTGVLQSIDSEVVTVVLDAGTMKIKKWLVEAVITPL